MSSDNFNLPPNYDEQESLITSNISVKPLINSLSPNLRLKIISPPETEPEKQKNYHYVLKSLISQDFSDQEIELIIKLYPIGTNRSNISSDISRLRDYDPGEEKLATKFVEEFKSKLHYCKEWEKWLVFNQAFWEEDKTNQTRNFIRTTVRDSEMPNFKKRASTIKGIEYILESDPLLVTKSSDWDKDQFIFATPKQTVDLKKAILRMSYPSEKISKSVSINPQKMPIPIWNQFLLETTNQNQAYVDFLQRICGYCATGSIKEHSLFFFYGPGGNGKSVFLNTLAAIMGDYAVIAPMGMFQDSKIDSHPTELAMLRGARLVIAQETQEGKPWDEIKIKTLTGGDEISARFMHEDFFKFSPTFKILISGNHKPRLRSVDDAIKRRLIQLPFLNKPASQNRNLFEDLKPEYPGILQWIIEGCLSWQKIGLNIPDVVKDFTEASFSEQDLLGQFLESKKCLDTFIIDKSATTFGEVYMKIFNIYVSWAQTEHNIKLNSMSSFKENMEKHGFISTNNLPLRKGVRGLLGIKFIQRDPSTIAKEALQDLNK